MSEKTGYVASQFINIDDTTFLERSFVIGMCELAVSIPKYGSTHTMICLLDEYGYQAVREIVIPFLKNVLHCWSVIPPSEIGVQQNVMDDLEPWLQTLLSDVKSICRKLEDIEKEARKLEEVAAKPMYPHKPGYIYLLQAITPTTYYKIGLSKDPVARIEILGIQLPFPIKPRHQFPTNNMHIAERQLHKRYADKRVNGEWFQLTDQDVQAICGIEHMDIEGIRSC